MFTILLVLIFVNVFYLTSLHLILWFENREKIKKTYANRKLSGISIIVPAYNEENIIKSTIKSLLNIDYPKNKMEIIVVDDGSKDRTYEIVKQYRSKNLRVLRKENGGKASALNFGLNHAKNEFVAIVDADTILEKTAIKKCMNYFDEKDVAAVTSHILVKNTGTWLGKLQNIDLMVISMLRKTQEFINAINATPGPLSIYRKNILLKVGGFDENNITEDVEIAWRLINNNYKIRMAFDAMSYSILPSNIKSLWKQRTRWVIGGIQTFWKYANCLFKQNSGLRKYHIPTYAIGYLLIVLGFFYMVYKFTNLIINYLIYIVKSFMIGTNPFSKLFEISYSANINTVYSIVLLVLSLFTLFWTYNNHRIRMHSPSSIFGFILIVPFLYFFVTVYGIYKYYTKGKIGWLTK